MKRLFHPLVNYFSQTKAAGHGSFKNAHLGTEPFNRIEEGLLIVGAVEEVRGSTYMFEYALSVVQLLKK